MISIGGKVVSRHLGECDGGLQASRDNVLQLEADVVAGEIVTVANVECERG